MTSLENSTLQQVTRLVQHRLQSARERVKHAREERMKRYYKGQVDTLTIVLKDLETVTFELGMELDPEECPEEPTQPVHSVMPAPKPSKPSKPSKRQKPPTAPSFTYQALAEDAVKRGIISQTSSHFYYDHFPDKHIQGFTQLYQAFEDNEVLRRTVQEALERLDAETVVHEPTPQDATHTTNIDKGSDT